MIRANIFEIKRFAVHDGEGIRTTVFFKGCPLQCVWCHNPEGISQGKQLAYFAHKCIACGECLSVCPTGAHEIENGLHTYHRDKCIACGKCESGCLGNALTFYGKEFTTDELLPILLKDREFYDNSGGGVTLSGGECLLQADFCAELLQKLKEHGIHTAVDTCGFIPKKSLDKVLPYTDIFLYDIKAIDEETHIHCTKQSNKQILENLLYLDKKDCSIEIRIPYIPDYNDKEIEKIGAFLSRLKNIAKVRVLAYHNLSGAKYASLDLPNNLPSRLPTDEELNLAMEKLKSHGLHAVR